MKKELTITVEWDSITDHTDIILEEHNLTTIEELGMIELLKKGLSKIE